MRKFIALIMTLAAFGLAASTAVAEHVNLGNLGTGAQNKVKNACGSDYQSNGDGFGCTKPCGNGGACSVWCNYKNSCSGSTASISGPGHGKVGTIVGVLHPTRGGGVQGPGANSPPGPRRGLLSAQLSRDLPAWRYPRKPRGYPPGSPGNCV